MGDTKSLDCSSYRRLFQNNSSLSRASFGP